MKKSILQVQMIDQACVKKTLIKQFHVIVGFISPRNLYPFARMMAAARSTTHPEDVECINDAQTASNVLPRLGIVCRPSPECSFTFTQINFRI